MSRIGALSWSGSVISWNADGVFRQLTLSGEVVNALLLRSGAIAVVYGQGWDIQASIINADGSVRAKLKNPFGSLGDKIFYYFIYDPELSVVLASAGGDFRCGVTESTGELSAPMETR